MSLISPTYPWLPCDGVLDELCKPSSLVVVSQVRLEEFGGGLLQLVHARLPSGGGNPWSSHSWQIYEVWPAVDDASWMYDWDFWWSSDTYDGLQNHAAG